MKRALLAFLALMMLLAVFASGVFAADAYDGTEPLSLTVEYVSYGAPMGGVGFEIYRAGDVSSDFALTLSGGFEKYPVELAEAEGREWDNIASVLVSYAQADGIEPLFNAETDENGSFTLEGFEAGLYLIAGDPCEKDGYYYTVQPALVCVPGIDAVTGGKADSVKIDVKSERRHVEPAVEKITKKVIKKWDDGKNENSRPEYITVQLLKNGTVFDTRKLTAKDSWKYEWKDLDAKDETGALIEWTVVEKAVDGYTVSVEKDGNAFVITNKAKSVTPPSPKPPKHDEKLPQTGMVMWPIPVLGGLGLLLLVIGIIRSRSSGKN